MGDGFRGGCARKKRETEVDEDEVFRELGEGGKYVFGSALSSSGHGVIGVMFESDAAEKERDDAGHAEPI